MNRVIFAALVLALGGCMNQCDSASSTAQQQSVPARSEVKPLQGIDMTSKKELVQLRRFEAGTGSEQE